MDKIIFQIKHTPLKILLNYTWRIGRRMRRLTTTSSFQRLMTSLHPAAALQTPPDHAPRTGTDHLFNKQKWKYWSCFSMTTDHWSLLLLLLLSLSLLLILLLLLLLLLKDNPLFDKKKKKKKKKKKNNI